MELDKNNEQLQTLKELKVIMDDIFEHHKKLSDIKKEGYRLMDILGSLDDDEEFKQECNEAKETSNEEYNEVKETFNEECNEVKETSNEECNEVKETSNEECNEVNDKFKNEVNGECNEFKDKYETLTYERNMFKDECDRLKDENSKLKQECNEFILKYEMLKYERNMFKDECNELKDENIKLKQGDYYDENTKIYEKIISKILENN